MHACTHAHMHECMHACMQTWAHADGENDGCSKVRSWCWYGSLMSLPIVIAHCPMQPPCLVSVVDVLVQLGCSSGALKLSGFACCCHHPLPLQLTRGARRLLLGSQVLGFSGPLTLGLSGSRTLGLSPHSSSAPLSLDLSIPSNSHPSENIEQPTVAMNGFACSCHHTLTLPWYLNRSARRQLSGSQVLGFSGPLTLGLSGSRALGLSPHSFSASQPLGHSTSQPLNF